MKETEMLACHSCVDMYQLPTDACIKGCRDAPRFSCDPLWDSIQSEARIEADREPFMRPLIEQAVLERKSIGDALAMVLSQRLCDSASDSSQLYKGFRELIAEDDLIAEDGAISQSARRDLSAVGEKDPAATSLLHPFMNFKGFLAVQSYRIAHLLWARHRRSLAHYIQGRASEVFGVDIHPAAKIGSGVFIDHGTGVVIGETAVVGDQVTILHGVTLGGTGKESGDRHPKVGDGVLIGASAQLLGNISIGEGSRIGASSVVLTSVEAYSTVAGIPARVVRRPQRPTIPITALDAARA
jgi:serine O-acetyltransferase